MSNDEQPAPERAVSLGYLLKHAHLQLSELGNKALAPFGIDGRELGILVVIAGPEPLSQQQVAQRLGVDRTTMVAMLDALERKTLVSRHPHPDDRRRNVVELTEPGREVFRSAIKAREEVERAYLAPLSAPSSEHLRNSLKAIVTAPENNRQ